MYVPPPPPHIESTWFFTEQQPKEPDRLSIHSVHVIKDGVRYRHRFMVEWDEDFDQRIFYLIEVLIFYGLIHCVDFFAESKGCFRYQAVEGISEEEAKAVLFVLENQQYGLNDQWQIEEEYDLSIDPDARLGMTRETMPYREPDSCWREHVPSRWEKLNSPTKK